MPAAIVSAITSLKEQPFHSRILIFFYPNRLNLPRPAKVSATMRVTRCLTDGEDSSDNAIIRIRKARNHILGEIGGGK
jgi:hypothetical protein